MRINYNRQLFELVEGEKHRVEVEVDCIILFLLIQYFFGVPEIVPWKPNSISTPSSCWRHCVDLSGFRPSKSCKQHEFAKLVNFVVTMLSRSEQHCGAVQKRALTYLSMLSWVFRSSSIERKKVSLSNLSFPTTYIWEKGMQTWHYRCLLSVMSPLFQSHQRGSF